MRDLRVAEVVELDMQLEEGKVRAYRAKVKVSFKYEGGDYRPLAAPYNTVRLTQPSPLTAAPPRRTIAAAGESSLTIAGRLDNVDSALTVRRRPIN